MLADAGDKLTAPDKAPVESAIAELKKALESSDDEAIKKGMDALMSAQHKVAEVLYRTAQTAGGSDAGRPPPPGAGASGPQGDVIDAEVVEDDKK